MLGNQDQYERQLRSRIQEEQSYRRKKNKPQPEAQRDYQNLYRQAVIQRLSRQRQRQSRISNQNRQAAPPRPESAANIVHDHPAPFPDEAFPRIQAQQDYLVEIVAHQVLYVVAPDKFDRQSLKLALSALIWTGVIIGCIMASIFDFTNVQNSDLKFQYHWLVLLVTAASVSLGLSIMIIYKKKILETLWVFSSLNASWYFILATIFYGTQVKGQWIITVIACVFQLIICLLFLQEKLWTILYLVLFSFPILTAFKADGHFQSVQWIYVMIILLFVGSSLVAFSIIFIVFGLIDYCKYRQANKSTMGQFYYMFVFLGITLFLATIATRALFWDKSGYFGLPTAGFIIIFLLFFVYPYRDEIILYNSGATLLTILSRADAIKFQKIQTAYNLYKLSPNWLTFEKADAQRYLRQSGEREIQIKKRAQCSICLSQKVCMTWMPCGHMAVCETCCKYLMDHSKIRCVICKVKAKQIYHIIQMKEQSEKVISDFYYKVG